MVMTGLPLFAVLTVVGRRAAKGREVMKRLEVNH
jgi:hypothetical protein